MQSLTALPEFNSPIILALSRFPKFRHAECDVPVHPEGNAPMELSFELVAYFGLGLVALASMFAFVRFCDRV